MSDRTLGTIAMICAPALLVEGLLLRGEENAAITGIASMVFMAGWICSNTVMRRVRAAGTGKWGRAVLLVQLAGLVLAFAFGLFEATGLFGRDDLIFNVTDAAWPLSMVFMLVVVGPSVIAAKRLPGWRRFVPILCPLWLLIAVGASAAFGEAAGYIGLALVGGVLGPARLRGPRRRPADRPGRARTRRPVTPQRLTGARLSRPRLCEERTGTVIKINDANNFRRTALGLCLIAGPLVALVGGLVTPWEESDTTAAYLASMAGSPVRAQVSAVLLYFGYLLIAVGIFGMLHLLRRRAVVLGHVAGVLAIWGWVTLPGLLSVDFYDLSLGESADRQAAIVISDRAAEYAGAAVLGFPVLVGFVGLVLLCVALWRAGFAPVWNPAILLAGFAVTFVSPPAALPFTVGFGLLFVALGYVGLKILRMSDEEWERGGVPAPDKGARPVAEAPAA